MKQILTGARASGGGRFKLPTEEEVEIAEILINLPKILAKSEFLRRYSFTWGSKKKRSALISRTESSPSPEKVSLVEAGESPVTPLCFGSGSDGELPSSVKKNRKRKAADDLVESYTKMQQEKEILVMETKSMKTLHQEQTSANHESKAITQTENHSRHIIDHENHHPQTSTSTPQIPQQQLVVDSNNCTNHSGGRFGLFDHIDTRVKINGETYDFMAFSQPLDQRKYILMDNDFRVRTEAAAARKKRMLRMKANKNMDISKYLVIDNGSIVKIAAAAAARKRRMLRMKENKKVLLGLRLLSRSR